MAAKKRGLGRGLDALLGTSTAPASAQNSDSETGKQLKILAVDLIQRGKYQPRRDMDPESLQELADSIRAQGVMQPIIVRAISDKKYEIIAGERRWRACCTREPWTHNCLMSAERRDYEDRTDRTRG